MGSCKNFLRDSGYCVLATRLLGSGFWWCQPNESFGTQKAGRMHFDPRAFVRVWGWKTCSKGWTNLNVARDRKVFPVCDEFEGWNTFCTLRTYHAFSCKWVLESGFILLSVNHHPKKHDCNVESPEAIGQRGTHAPGIQGKEVSCFSSKRDSEVGATNVQRCGLTWADLKMFWIHVFFKFSCRYVRFMLIDYFIVCFPSFLDSLIHSTLSFNGWYSLMHAWEGIRFMRDALILMVGWVWCFDVFKSCGCLFVFLFVWLIVWLLLVVC